MGHTSDAPGVGSKVFVVVGGERRVGELARESAMKLNVSLAAAAALWVGLIGCEGSRAAEVAPAPEASELPAPSYTADGKLLLPADYREWIYLSSGLDMSYSESPAMAGHSMFDNVFVDVRAYRAFVRTGTWPDATMLLMEMRGATQKGSINKRGHYQAGGVMGIEVHVKDSRRFDGGWAFFGFDGTQPAAMRPVSEDCYSCHREHGALDTTFVQFYPTLLEIATQKGTLNTAAKR